jgi:hypothetical protein
MTYTEKRKSFMTSPWIPSGLSLSTYQTIQKAIEIEGYRACKSYESDIVSNEAKINGKNVTHWTFKEVLDKKYDLGKTHEKRSFFTLATIILSIATVCFFILACFFPQFTFPVFLTIVSGVTTLGCMGFALSSKNKYQFLISEFGLQRVLIAKKFLAGGPAVIHQNLEGENKFFLKAFIQQDPDLYEFVPWGTMHENFPTLSQMRFEQIKKEQPEKLKQAVLGFFQNGTHDYKAGLMFDRIYANHEETKTPA